MAAQIESNGSYPSTFEAQYVASTVGPVLTKAMAEIVLKKPMDPVEYLANYLYKHVDNMKRREEEAANRERLEMLMKEKILEDLRKEEMRREREEMQRKEEEKRREKELEERRKRELEELSKRKEELANTAPPLPSLVEDEEEDNTVEFGQTKLHELAATEGADLSAALRESSCVAARNAQFKTPREVALEKNLTDNVRQIDEFIWELVAQEDYKQLTDLVVLGFDGLTPIIEAKYGNYEQMIENGLHSQAEQVYKIYPQIQAKIKQLQESVDKNNVDTFKAALDARFMAFYRDAQGKSSLHQAIEKKSFKVALYLAEQYPILSKLNDSLDKLPLDLLQAIDPTSLDEAQLAVYTQLLQQLSN